MVTSKKLVSESTPYVALLRGVNVGGKHILPMKELAAMFAATQCVDVKTYIQSGNVVFTAPPKVVQGLAATLEKKIEARFGFAAPVIVRSGPQLAQIVRHNPFLKNGMPENNLHVYFLADKPTVAAIATLDPDRSVPDVYRVLGQEIYGHFPNGMGRSKLTSAYFDSRLSTICTARNWATVLKLAEMTKP